nr:sauvagine precursor [Phyllomedusa sauvagii]
MNLPSSVALLACFLVLLDRSELAPLERSFFHESGPEESARSLLDSDPMKRQGPPISIDLSLELLRKMIEIEKQEKEKQQAANNRLLLDTIGK